METFYCWRDFERSSGFSREMILWVSQNLKRKSTSCKMKYVWIITSKPISYSYRRRKKSKTGIRIYDQADAMAFKLRWL